MLEKWPLCSLSRGTNTKIDFREGGMLRGKELDGALMLNLQALVPESSLGIRWCS